MRVLGGKGGRGEFITSLIFFLNDLFSFTSSSFFRVTAFHQSRKK